MKNLSQNSQKDIQSCLCHAWTNHQKNPGSRIMMGPGFKDNDTRHFWIVKKDGAVVVDTTPGYSNYPYYLQGEVLDIDKNRDILEKLSPLSKE